MQIGVVGLGRMGGDIVRRLMQHGRRNEPRSLGSGAGYCMMIGGQKDVIDRLDPIFAALAPGLGNLPRTPGRANGDPRAEQGYIHVGPSGAGHFVKMVQR
jgi:6-phosphogluconate dehydrogenase (decarboxylating)